MAHSLGSVYASKVFLKLLEQSKDRLQKSAALRAAMLAQIEAGHTPTGYRADFLDDTSREIIEWLCAAAEKFNREHPDDMCSTADFLDVLATARKKILDGAKMARVAEAVPPGPKS